MDDQDTKADEISLTLDINNELEKARQAREARLKGWKPHKDPGQLRAGQWEMGVLARLSYGELHKVFGDAWVWGPNVRPMKGGDGMMATQFGVTSPDGDHLSLVAEWPRTKELDKEAQVDWTVTGFGTGYDSLGEWLAGVVGRIVCFTGTDKDDQETYRVTSVYSPPETSVTVENAEGKVDS